MELNQNDRRGEYARPYDDSGETTGRIFISRKKVFCFIIIVVILAIISAVIGTVVSMKKFSMAESKTMPLTNRTRKTAGDERNSGHKVWDEPRLPKNVIPLHYWITQRINMSADTFYGQVRVKLLVNSDTVIVMLHNDPKRMKYMLIQLRTSRGGRIKLDSVKQHNEYLVIMTGETLRRRNTYLLSIKYNAPFVSYPKQGLYKAYNKKIYDHKRRRWVNQKSMAVTLFFPVAARKSFPCFDEPNMKATFTLTLMYSKGYRALSNMPLTKRYETKSLSVSTFKTSLKMPTYLLNYVISDYTSSETTTVNKTKIGVWSPSTTSNSRRLALAIANVTLPYYQALFGVGYALPKLDMVTVPEYKYGAMEHWGLINYIQDALLFSEKRPNAGLMKRQAIALLISHEIVHQWFGNLVTLKWWNDVLIQEGVASYFHFFGAAKFMPQSDIMDQFYSIMVRQAMEQDSLESTKCIAQEVKSTSEAEVNVIPIVYKKGAAILRMLHVYLGDGPFMNGFRFYLKKFAYKNVDKEDLWSCISETSNIDVPSVMRSWALQPGFPIITTSEEQGGKIILSQRRYLPGQHSPGQSGNETWRIPITFVTSKDPRRVRHYLLTSSNSTLDVEGDWFKLNADAGGYYIVNYNMKNWNAITRQLHENHKVFSTLDRASIIKDSFTMATEGLIPFSVALDATKYLEKESNWIPWQYAKHYISDLIMRLPQRSSLRLKIINYFGKITRPIYDVVGWEEKPTLREQMLQETAISAALNARDKHAIEVNTKIFQDWLQNQTYIPDSIAKVVYFYGVFDGSDQDWELVYHRYGYEWRADKRAVLLSALGASRNPWILSNFLTMAARTRYISITNAINAVADGSRLGRSIAWVFMKRNWDKLPFSYNMDYALDMYVTPVVSKFASLFQYKDVKRFLRSKLPQKKLSKNAAALLRKIRRNVEWAKRETQSIENWFDAYNGHDS